jgi:hypothetical protein
VCSLSAQPITVWQAEKLAQPKIGVCRNGAFTSDNLTNALCGNTNLLGQAILAQPHWLEKLFQKDLAGSYGFELTHDSFTSVVIHDFNIFCPRFRPMKADAPLIVDTNAILAGAVTLECFQSIAGRYPQVLKSAGNFELSQLPSGYRCDIHEALNADAFWERFGIGTLEGFDHA